MNLISLSDIQIGKFYLIWGLQIRFGLSVKNVAKGVILLFAGFF